MFLHSKEKLQKFYRKRFSFLVSSATIILMYFVDQFLSMHVSIQDLVVSELSTGITVYIFYWILALYRIHPSLVLLPIGLVAGLTHVIIISNNDDISLKSNLMGKVESSAASNSSSNKRGAMISKLPNSKQYLHENHKMNFTSKGSNDQNAIISAALPSGNALASHQLLDISISDEDDFLLNNLSYNGNENIFMDELSSNDDEFSNWIQLCSADQNHSHLLDLSSSDDHDNNSDNISTLLHPFPPNIEVSSLPSSDEDIPHIIKVPSELSFNDGKVNYLFPIPECIDIFDSHSMENTI